jgi:hypothetical protein
VKYNADCSLTTQNIISFIKPHHLIYQSKAAVYSEIDKKHINALYG